MTSMLARLQVLICAFTSYDATLVLRSHRKLPELR